MYSSTTMNGSYQPVGQPSQTVHAATPPAYDTMRNQQPGTANTSYSFWTVDPRIQPTQNCHVPFRDGTQPHSQMANRQTSAAPRQASSSQSTAGRNHQHYVLYQKYPHLTDILEDIPSMPYQNPAQNSKMQTPPKMNTTHSQQNTTAYLIQPVTCHGNQSIRTQDVQNNGVLKSYQVINGKPSNPIYMQAATLVPLKQTVCTSTIQPTRPPANNHKYQQNVSEHRFPTSNPPNYSEAISVSPTHNSITTNPPPRGQIWGYSSMSQTTQQDTAQLNSTPNNAREATCRTTCSSIKSNGLPLKATAASPKEEAMIISKIAEALRKSYQADPVGRHPVKTNSPSTWRLITPASQVGEVGRMECHQTMQHGTSAGDRSDSYATQHLQRIASRCLPQSVLSRTQYIVSSSQQSSAPDVYRVTTEDGITDGYRERNAFFPKNNSISMGNVVESTSDVPQFMQLPEGNLLQRTETQLTVKNNQEMRCSVEKIDSSIQSSPSRTSTRAVAVVQPLLQENHTIVNNQNSSNPINQLEECSAKYSTFRNPLKICTTSAVAKKSQVIKLSEGSNKHLQDGPQVKTQNHSHAQGSEQSSDRSGALAVQQSVTSEGPEGQHRDMNKAEVPLDQNTCDFDLSSIPTTQWTPAKLINFTMESEKAQTQHPKELETVQDIMRIFWTGKIDNLKNKLISGWYKTLMTDVTTFCCDHVTNDSVILSQVKESYSRQLKKYRFLQHNEIYSEPPYQSSWLNVNEQVDDIDKEFGFSRNLRPPVSTLGSDSQLDDFGTTSSIFAHNLSDVSNDAFSQTELRSVVQVEEDPTVEITSSPISSPNDIDPDGADSNDPHYSFEIQVLSPEEAKAIFCQIQSQLPQSMDTPSQPENVPKSSVEDELPDFGQSVPKSPVENELPDVGDTLKDAKLESKKKVSLIDEFCCLTGWIEKFFGKDTTLKCACKEKQDHKDCTEKTIDKETEVQNNNQPAIRLDNVLSAIETDHQMSAEENIDSQVVCSSTDVCNDISQSVDLTEDEERLRSHSAQEKQNMSPSIIDDSQLSPLVLSDSEVEDLSCSGSEIPFQIRDNGIWKSDSEEKCVQEPPMSVGQGQSSPSDCSKREFMKVIDLESHVSDTAVGCRQAQLTSTDVAESSLELEEPTQTGPAARLHNTSSQRDKLETVERKRKLHSDEEMCQLLKNLKKRVNRNVSVNAAESKPLASNDKTVQLVLYGSKRTVFGDRKIDGEYTGSHASHRPPNMVSVTLNPSKRKSTVPTPEYSVKGWIHEKWRRSYLPTTLKIRKKLKTHHGTLPRIFLKEAETACPSKTKELPVCNQMKRKGNTDCGGSRKKRRIMCTRLVLGEESRRKDVATVKPLDKERRVDESHTHTPGRENYILKFSVLPDTFSFADGPNGRKQTTAGVSGNSAGGKSPGKAITAARGTW